MSGTGVLNALLNRGMMHMRSIGPPDACQLEAARFHRVFIALRGRGGEDG
jgi:hypothetical protein